MNVFRHFGCGYVKVRLSGLSPERFLNLCGSANMELWKVCFVNGNYEFFMGAKDFLSCRPFIKKAKVRPKIIKKFGLPFFLHKNRKRKMWAAGCLSFFALLYILSLFIWDIDYRGNTTYTDDELGHFLESLQITCGIKKDKLSCDELEEALRNHFDGITWASVRISGTRLYVQIKENEVLLAIPEPDEEPCDLIAAYDGVITSIIVRSGMSVVQVGDTVEKGQVLVSGCIPMTDDSEEIISRRYIHADADIIGQVRHSKSKEISLWHRQSVPTGKIRNGISLHFANHSFVWMIPNIRNTEWRTVTQTKRLRLMGDFYLPIDYGRIKSFEVSSHDAKYTETEINKMAECYKNEVSEKLIEKGVQIIENNVRILVNGSLCRLEADLLTEESIQERSTINDN
ncbi:MAG: sporulation protein YqfD [Clostridium sp.]